MCAILLHVCNCSKGRLFLNLHRRMIHAGRHRTYSPQARAIRALASGMDWPVEIQKKAQFDCAKLILKTHAAMTRHSNDPWLLCAG